MENKNIFLIIPTTFQKWAGGLLIATIAGACLAFLPDGYIYVPTLFIGTIITLWFLWRPKSVLLVFVFIAYMSVGVRFSRLDNLPITGSLDVIMFAWLSVVGSLYMIAKGSAIRLMRTADKIFLLWLALMVVSIFVSPDKITSISKVVRYIAYFVFLLLVKIHFRTERDRRKLLYALLASGIPPMIVALLQFVLHLPSLSVYVSHVSFRPRVFGAGPWALGALLLVELSILLALIPYNKAHNKAGTQWVTIYIVLAVSGILSTFYRSAWLGLIALLGCALFFANRRQVAVAIIALSGVVAFVPQIIQRFMLLFEPGSNLYNRYRLWQWGIQVVTRSLPSLIFGRGWGSFAYYSAHLNGAPTIVETAESQYVEVFFSLGIVGLLVFLALLFALGYQAYMVRTRFPPSHEYHLLGSAQLMALSGIAAMSISYATLSVPSGGFQFWVLTSIFLSSMANRKQKGG